MSRLIFVWWMIKWAKKSHRLIMKVRPELYLEIRVLLGVWPLLTFPLHIGLSYQILLTNVRKNAGGQDQTWTTLITVKAVLPRSFVIQTQTSPGKPKPPHIMRNSEQAYSSYWSFCGIWAGSFHWRSLLRLWPLKCSLFHFAFLTLARFYSWYGLLHGAVCFYLCVCLNVCTAHFQIY